MSASDPVQADDSPRTVTQERFGSELFGFWLLVWLGTALAGSLFGLLLGLALFPNEGAEPAISGAIGGIIVGLVLAGILAAPVVVTIATLSWAIGSRRWRVYLAIIAGGATGTFSTLLIADFDIFESSSVASGVAIALATLLGSMGAWISALAWARRVGQTAQADDDSVVDAELPISNRLFRIGVLVAVIAVVLGTCLGIAYLIQLARETARRNECRSNLRQIALCLHNYRDAHRHLPPAYITDKTGKPVLSWRVAAARHCYYDTDFSEFLDYDQPWNSPKNAKFLNHLGGFLHCPSSGKKPENPLTDYVAVVGPDTLWPGEQPGDLKKHPKGILVVEWPRSDIHWAEPRDITVEEFLDWFRAKPAKPDSFHPGCLLYVDAEGNVGELRNDTDTEIVRRLLVGQSTVGAASPAPSQ